MARLQEFRAWIEETHSTAFELRRHFFARFFDSELVSSPDQWRVVAGGVGAVLISLSILYMPAYYHKYRMLNVADTPDGFNLAIIADALLLIVLTMSLVALFTTMQWPSLFPTLRDYLALAGLPVRMRQIFTAQFTALLTYAALCTLAVTTLPSIALPGIMSGPLYGGGSLRQIPALFISSTLAGFFVFFSLIALQGVLLNLLPLRLINRVSLALQGVILLLLLSSAPLILSIPSLTEQMTARPQWAVSVPPLWFLGLHQVIDGNHEPLARALALRAILGSLTAAALAILAYIWSYRRHRVRILESPVDIPKSGSPAWISALVRRLTPLPQEHAVFTFVAKTLARSRHHRLVLTAFAAIAVALVSESFTAIALSHGALGFFHPGPALQQAAISAPLALSLFVLAGLRYLFRLPVELRANWLFQFNEPGNRILFLRAVAKILLLTGALPVALLTLPFEIALLGPRGLAVSLLALLPSLILVEIMLIQFGRVPFTCSYLPGRRPVIQTLLTYGVCVGLYVTGLSWVIYMCLRSGVLTTIYIVTAAAIWYRVRRGRAEAWQTGEIEFEEKPEQLIQRLEIGVKA